MSKKFFSAKDLQFFLYFVLISLNVVLYVNYQLNQTSLNLNLFTDALSLFFTFFFVERLIKLIDDRRMEPQKQVCAIQCARIFEDCVILWYDILRSVLASQRGHFRIDEDNIHILAFPRKFLLDHANPDLETHYRMATGNGSKFINVLFHTKKKSEEINMKIERIIEGNIIHLLDSSIYESLHKLHQCCVFDKHEFAKLVYNLDRFSKFANGEEVKRAPRKTS